MATKKIAELKPIYLIWGKEELLLEEAVSRLRKRVAAEGDLDFNSDVFDGESASAHAVVAAANTLPFASEKRLIVVRHVDKMVAAEQAVLAEYAGNPSPTSVVVLVAGKVSRSSKLFKAIDAAGGASEYRSPRRNEYSTWVIKQFQVKGRQISPDGAGQLVSSVGRDLRKLDSEIDKIIAYAGEKARLDRDDVSAVVAETAPISIFQFLDGVGARNAGQALGLLADLLDSGESLHGILAMTVRHVRSMLSVRALLDRGVPQNAMAREVGASDWQVRNIAAQARRFDEAELIGALRGAAEVEASMKSGKGDPRTTFEQWIIGICTRS